MKIVTTLILCLSTMGCTGALHQQLEASQSNVRSLAEQLEEAHNAEHGVMTWLQVYEANLTQCKADLAVAQGALEETQSQLEQSRALEGKKRSKGPGPKSHDGEIAPPKVPSK
jgi:chromosome segregation ATPase